MSTTDQQIEQELEDAHASLLRELAAEGWAQGVHILTPPPGDDPE
jgi:hypothetical protein